MNSNNTAMLPVIFKFKTLCSTLDLKDKAPQTLQVKEIT